MQTRLIKHSIEQRFFNIRKRTEDICKSLKPEDVSIQPTEFVSPPKWHLAHTTWFFEQFVLTEYKVDYRLFHKDFAYYFNSYYDNVGTRVMRADRGLMTRPALEDVLAYRTYVNKHMADFIKSKPANDIFEIIELGLQHEQQHQELLLYDIKYIFGHQPAWPVLNYTIDLPDEPREQNYIPIPGGLYNIGYKGKGFCWDNELAPHKVYINEFKISNRLVTNAEYLEFMAAGGYNDFNYWHADGWDFMTRNQIAAPQYWYKVEGQWMRYTLNGLKTVEPSNPVCHISMYEAFAYSQWKGMRLPTEFEWEIASKQFNYGKLWEWTNSAYLPYPNFIKEEGALGEYNGKFMINQMVLRGGSVASPPNHLRPTYRNFFQPEMRWLFSGIRLVK